MATRTQSSMASYYIQRKKHHHTTQPHTAMVVTEDLPPLSVLRRSLDPWKSMGLTPTTSQDHPPGESGSLRLCHGFYPDQTQKRRKTAENSQRGEGSRPCRWRVPVFPEMNVYHRPSLEESPTVDAQQSKAYQSIRSQRDFRCLHSPREAQAWRRGRVVLRTQVGILPGKDRASAAAPFLEEDALLLCLQRQ